MSTILLHPSENCPYFSPFWFAFFLKEFRFCCFLFLSLWMSFSSLYLYTILSSVYSLPVSIFLDSFSSHQLHSFNKECSASGWLNYYSFFFHFTQVPSSFPASLMIVLRWKQSCCFLLTLVLCSKRHNLQEKRKQKKKTWIKRGAWFF